MSQRSSGYKRKKNDEYFTPAWVTRALLCHIPKRIEFVWEPASGKGAIAKVLSEIGRIEVIISDLALGRDFIRITDDVQAVITNPPFKLAREFIEHALAVTKRKRGFVAMLLATDFDHAKTRRALFDCPQFSKKLILTKRIVWFEPMIASPSSNHAWFIWDWRHKGPPTIAYHYESVE
jgi:hypothetical protein